MKIILFTATLLLILSYSTGTIQAQDTINLGNNQPYGIPAVNNPNASVGNILGNALKIMLIFGGLAVVAFFAWGAFDWITAGGDKEKIAGARKKMVNSIIGLVLLSLTFFIISLVGDIAGFNPLATPDLPGLGDAPKPFQPPTTTTP